MLKKFFGLFNPAGSSHLHLASLIATRINSQPWSESCITERRLGGLEIGRWSSPSLVIDFSITKHDFNPSRFIKVTNIAIADDSLSFNVRDIKIITSALERSLIAHLNKIEVEFAVKNQLSVLAAIKVLNSEPN
jgi:hypothetical protein